MKAGTITRAGLAALLSGITACGGAPPAADSARVLSTAQRDAMADTIRALSDSIFRAGERLDATAMTARFQDGLDAAFGGASGIVLTTSRLRQNIEIANRSLRSQRFQVVEQRVAVLGPDAASTTGWGNIEAVTITGARKRATQAFTFVWGRRDGQWRIIQAHFSSQLMGVVAPPDTTSRRP